MRVRRAPSFRFNPEFSFVQAFLSEKNFDKPGKSTLVFEVYINRLSGGLVCTCPGFLARLRCSHIESVPTRTDGAILLHLDEELELTDEIKQMINNDSDFAYFYLSNYGKVRILEDDE